MSSGPPKVAMVLTNRSSVTGRYALLGAAGALQRRCGTVTHL
jgi:hypothetical protein